MSETIEAYPLQWPAPWPRTTVRQRSRFDRRMTVAEARDELLRELRLMGAQRIVLNTNVPVRQDGLPYSNRRDPDDPAVAVYFALGGDQVVIPCDRWDRVQDNLHAVALTVAALRGLERWGAREMVAAAFRGFAALPAGTAGEAWWTVLGVAATASEVEVEQAYRRLAKRHHPDAGGDAERFHRVAEAYKQAKGQKTA